MSQRKTLLLFCLSLCLGLLSCSQPSERLSGGATAIYDQHSKHDASASTGAARLSKTDRKVIYTAQVEVIVEEMTAAQKQVARLIEAVRKAGGYLEHQDVVGMVGSSRIGNWTVRVPLEEFDSFVESVQTLGELQRNTRDAQDVTEAYADLEAHLHNKEVAEKRLLSHLEKTDTLKDTLELEKELSRVRGEVEQLQGQLNLLKNKTDLAKVILTLHERAHYIPPTKPTFGRELSRTFRESLEALTTLGKGLTLLAVFLAPWIIVLLVVGLPVLLVRRRYFRKPPQP